MKNCLECQKSMNGRSDKKFCDDGCRNAYNNRINSESNHYVKSINTLLKKNRKLLQSIIPPEGKLTVSEKTLKIMGFNFEYFTNVYETRKGVVYTFCYEYGYLKIKEGVFMLVKKQEHPLNATSFPAASDHLQ